MKKQHIIIVVSLILYLTIGFIIGINRPESDFYTSWMIIGLYFMIAVSFLIGALMIRYNKSLLIFFKYFFLIPIVILIISLLVSFKFPNAVLLTTNIQGESIINETYAISVVVGVYGMFSLFLIIPITIIGLIILKWYSNIEIKKI